MDVFNLVSCQTKAKGLSFYLLLSKVFTLHAVSVRNRMGKVDFFFALLEFELELYLIETVDAEFISVLILNIADFFT
jgi:hypothetical protein